MAAQFASYRKLSLLYHLLVRQKGPIASKGLCKGGSIAFVWASPGIAPSGGYRTRLDRKSRDSGRLSFWPLPMRREDLGTEITMCKGALVPNQLTSFCLEASCLVWAETAASDFRLSRHPMGLVND